MHCSCRGLEQQIDPHSSDGRRIEMHQVSRTKTTRNSGFRNLQCSFYFSLVILAFLLSAATPTLGDKNDKAINKPKNNDKPRSSETSSLGDSISQSTDSIDNSERSRLSKAQWKIALKEIKNLSVDPPQGTKSLASPGSKPGAGFLSQWKLLLDEPVANDLTNSTAQSDLGAAGLEIKSRRPWGGTRSVRRFEGFPSWERMLQDWSDDVQEYMDKIEEESANTKYSLSGKSSPKEDADRAGGIELSEDSKITAEEPTKQLNETSKDDIVSSSRTEESDISELEAARARRSQLQMPIPAPARPGEEVLPHTDIADKSKQIWIVTTASLPWMTGTAVNPLLRAAYMTADRKEAGGSVTLMLPWLERKEDQDQVYGVDRGFDSPEQQEEYLRTWLRETANLVEASEELNIKWYTAWQNKAENSLYSMGDITALVPAEEVDICILEEPEHLNWYRAPGESWTSKFKHVVGIIHTNYFVYAQEQPAALIRAPGMRLLCSWMCRAHCHRVIKLSGTLGQFAPEKELVENVHGVRAGFLEAGEEVRKRLQSSDASTDPVFGPEAESSVYFIGKMLWSKGLGSLMELLKYAEESAGIKTKVDMYGGGPDLDAASKKAGSLELEMPFHGPIDHAKLSFTHKIFINPSTSEVLCTTVAEALAMGKFVIVPSHPSNDFFAQFPNCLTYTSKEEFVGDLYYALTHSPQPLTAEYAHVLSWQAATERLEAAGSIPVREAELMREALSSNDAGIEITLPPLIENEKGRKLVATTLRQSRNRYRQFRSRLSQEIEQSTVLPNPLKKRLQSELNKRLDLDIDNILESPKLQLKVSPAELDKQLLDLYRWVADGPSGDVLRIIGGGQDVAFQDLYIKTQARKERRRTSRIRPRLSFGAFDTLDDSEAERRTTSQWINLALKRNLPKKNATSTHEETSQEQKSTSQKNRDQKKMSMTLSLSSVSLQPQARQILTRSLLSATASQFCPKRNPSSSLSLLI